MQVVEIARDEASDYRASYGAAIPVKVRLKGKFGSGIEDALASTLNHDFNWKQLSEMILFLLMFSKFIWVTLIQKQQKYKSKETLNFGRGRRILLWFEI